MNTKDQNLGLWYYKTFFYTFERECDSFLNATWENTIVQKVELSYSQKMTTLYPGLVCGIGYEHELKIDKELKLGLSFDFTTGQPYIPGSSIKGVLRQAFRDKAFVQYASNKAGIHTEGIDWGKLENDIFESITYEEQKPKCPYKTDVFFDAFIVGTYKGNDKKILSDDCIACHQDWNKPSDTSKDINVIRFLKVRSGVTFLFGFRLFDTIISRPLKSI